VKSNSYAAIVLAAGLSTRMKCLKPLLEIGEKTLVDRLTSTFLHCGLDVYLVTGWMREKLIDRINTRGIWLVENPNFRAGMLSSIKAGLSSVKNDYKAFFIAPVDIPLVRAYTIKRLLLSAENNQGKIIYPVFDKKRGHPPIIPDILIHSILRWDGEGGLHSFLGQYSSLALEVPVSDRNILFDIDTMRDYKVAVGRFQRYEIPTKEECEVILKDICTTTPEIRNHGNKVAEVATTIGQALLKTGVIIDIEVVQAAALLHDVAKGQSNHPITGSKLLQDMGFGTIGKIVAAHHDLPMKIPDYHMETKIVYLADKMVEV